MKLESCIQCGTVVDLENMTEVDYEDRGKIGEYYDTEKNMGYRYFWIFCPNCKEKVFLVCND